MREKKLYWIGGALLIAAFLLAYAGEVVPILGVLAAAFAPDVFLAGLVVLAMPLVLRVTRNKAGAAAAAALLAIVLGLNTRLPSVISDALEPRSEATAARKLTGEVGQPLHIETSANELAARWRPHSGVRPACYPDACVATRGFRTQEPGIMADYWRENVVGVARGAGFTQATAGEKAPKLIVSQAADAHFADVRLQLRDAEGAAVAQFEGRYRNGYPLESPDGSQSGRSSSPLLALQYLLHGNMIGTGLSRWARPAPPPPLQAFLKTAVQLSHHQGAPPDISGGILRMPAVGATPTDVKLEILEERAYDPVWVIKADQTPGEVSNKTWTQISYDKDLYLRCGQLLKSETPGAPLMQTWHLFVNDPTGRKKVRYTGSPICAGDELWFLDNVVQKGKLTLTKYTAAGDLVYRIAFEKPAPIYGFSGHILQRTFKAENGYLNFDWWDTNQSGYDRHVKRSMKARVAEPPAPKSSAP